MPYFETNQSYGKYHVCQDICLAFDYILIVKDLIHLIFFLLYIKLTSLGLPSVYVYNYANISPSLVIKLNF